MFNVMDISSSSSSSSASDDEETIVGVIIADVNHSHTKIEDYVQNTVEVYTDAEFIEHFRVSRNLVASLAQQYEDSALYPSHDTGHVRISADNCILIFLWYASHEAASFRDVGDRFNITISTLHVIIEKVSLFLSNMSSVLITWPTLEERLAISEDFRNKGFPDVIECIDGTHIKIDTATDPEDPESYFNRNKYYSIQMQAVCDNKRKIRDVFMGYPGSVHDTRVFRNSLLFDTLPAKCGEKFILGDSAYPCLRHILTPYRDNRQLTPVERNFNKTLSQSRITIEHTFGILKQRFRQLYHCILRSIIGICHFIRACCVLHNLCLEDQTLEFGEVPSDALENHVEEIVGNDENEGNPAGHHFRNYIASILYHGN